MRNVPTNKAHSLLVLAGFVAVVLGCSATDTASPPPVPQTASGGAGGAVGGNGNGGGVDLDGGSGGFPTNADTACKRVDILVSLDASGSMTDEHLALGSSVLPKMAEKLVLAGKGLEDFRVGVIDACPKPANLHSQGAATPNCSLSSGKPWIESTTANLAQELACLGDLYLDDMQCSGENDDEQPASAAAAALSDPINVGFVRDDALLVVLAVTDEDEKTVPSATMQQVHDQLVSAKSDPAWVVFVGVGGSAGCKGVYGDANNAKQLKELTALFGDHGIFWDLCQGKLEDSLPTAIASIQSACESAPPIPR